MGSTVALSRSQADLIRGSNLPEEALRSILIAISQNPIQARHCSPTLDQPQMDYSFEETRTQVAPTANIVEFQNRPDDVRLNLIAGMLPPHTADGRTHYDCTVESMR